MIAFIASLYFYRNWYFTQLHKCIGFYYVNQGDKAYRKSKYQSAIDNYKTALRHYPGHSRASCNLGNIYVSFENYYEAVNAYENALKYSPNFMACRMDLGIILSEKMANYDKAIQEYGRVINSRPLLINIPFVYNNKETAKINKGLAYYNMGLAYRGKSVYMGDKSYTSVKYLKKAKESYQQAEKYLKNDFDNTYNLALTDHLLGDYNSAAYNYCKAINIEPENFDAHYNFSLLLRTMKMNEEALLEFEKTVLLLEKSGNSDKNKYVLGIIGELRRRIIAQGDSSHLTNRVDLTSLSPDEIMYTKGKVVYSKQKEVNFKKLLKCTYQKQFEEMKK